MADQKNKRTGRIRHGEALAHYLAMGANRSLKKLWEHYRQTMVHPPALVTIEKWSARFDWAATAKEHDERVAAQLGERVEEAAVEEGWDKITTLTDLAQKALNKAISGLDGDTVKSDDAYQIQALLNSAVTALKYVELLSGRATSRTETFPAKQFAPQWMAERLAGVADKPTGPTLAAQPADGEEPETVH